MRRYHAQKRDGEGYSCQSSQHLQWRVSGRQSSDGSQEVWLGLSLPCWDDMAGGVGMNCK